MNKSIVDKIKQLGGNTEGLRADKVLLKTGRVLVSVIIFMTKIGMFMGSISIMSSTKICI